MRKELDSYLDFKKFANQRLHRLKEERITQYEKYVREHFGRLNEDNEEKLFHIGKHYGLNPATLVVDNKVTYNDKDYEYFIHDDNKYIALNDKEIIVDTGDFNSQSLTRLSVVSEDAEADYEQMKDHIYNQREKRAIANMQYKKSDPAKYAALEKKATDDFQYQLKQLRDFAKTNRLKK